MLMLFKYVLLLLSKSHHLPQFQGNMEKFSLIDFEVLKLSMSGPKSLTLPFTSLC
jgi:hypothetical protein